MKNLSGVDVAFIAPGEIRFDRNQEKLSIFKHLVPNMVDVTGKALDISHSLAFYLPKDINLEELATLFGKSFEKHST